MRKLWVLFLITTTLQVYPQSGSVPLRFQKITIEQGLPHNYVHSVTQDKKGFIWIGTNYGLARFDGYNFKVFQPDFLKPYSISQKPVRLVYADTKGYLWLWVNGGINKMDLKTERFSGYFFDSTNKIPLGNYHKFFHEDSDSNFWIATTNGIFLYNPEKDKFIYTLFKKNIKTKDNEITSLADDNNGNLWFVIENKVYILSKKNFNISTFGEFSSNPKLDSIEFHTVYSKEKDKLWLTTYRNGLLNYTISNGKIEYFLENVPFLSNFFIDKKNNLYVVTNNPTYNLLVCRKENINKKLFLTFPLFDSKNLYQLFKFVEDKFDNVWFSSTVGLGRFNFNFGVTLYKENNFLPNNISDNNIENIFIDRTDNLWICPLRKGINKADLWQKPIKYYAAPIKSINDFLSDKNVSSVFEDSQKNIWISSSNFGVSMFNKYTEKYYRYFLNTSNQVTSIYEDKEGFIWLGTNWDVTFKVKPLKLNNLSDKKELLFQSVESYNVLGVRKITADKANNVWFASLTGLVEFQKAEKKLINYSTLYDSLNFFSGFYRTVFVDKNQVIWTGSNSGGLCKFEKTKKRFKHYLHDTQNSKSISNNTVYGIYEDLEGYLWVGTGQGLDIFNPKTEEFEHSGIGDELFKRSIFSVIPDTKGNIWMSCDIGIIRYNIKTNQSSFFGQADGLQNNELNTTTSLIAPSGEIFYGGSGGLISFYPSQMLPNPIHAKPVITNILIHNKVISPGDSLNGRVILQKQVWETNKISLYHFETDFTIEFSALHYSAPENIKYYYKLDGFNSDWVSTDSKHRYVSYTGLPPGNYTFILKATNNDGVMCESIDEVRFDITIIPPFWQTIWFKIILFISLLGILLLFVWYRIRTLRNKNKQLNKKVKERTLELEQANKFLEERTYELEEANSIMEERQEEIYIQKEEILTHNETLENNNQLLQQHQKQIVEQNIELDQHRNKLEFLVEVRTKELEKALLKAEESDRLKTSFLTNMSHEIRTPMNAIIGFSSLLRDKDLSNRFDEFINIITTNGHTLLTLINDILELSSMQTQQVSLKPTTNNLFDILNKQYETHKIEIEKNKLALKLNVALINQDFQMVLDEIRLEQVLSNLILNALKFTKEGYIEFGISEIKDTIIFYVKDTGIGIPKDTGNAVFERFYKIENNNTQLFRGTGLGLAICKSIVTLWNGDIWYESEVGIGTTFFFTHPLTFKCTPDNKQNNETVNTNFDWNGMRILIAEDEESNFKLLKNYFLKTNAEIFWAKNGVEALQIANNNQIHLVLMDIKMPIMNGIEASIKLKELFPELPIIAQTAYAFKNEVDEILNSGINAYIIKPILKANLFDLIKKYL